MVSQSPPRHSSDPIGLASPQRRYEVAVVSDVEGHAQAKAKEATIELDLSTDGRPDAPNAAEVLMVAVATCMAKGVRRAASMNGFEVGRIEVRIRGVRQDRPPKIESIHYEILVDTDQSEHRLELLHRNVRKFGTVTNTVAPGTELSGELRRMPR